MTIKQVGRLNQSKICCESVKSSVLVIFCHQVTVSQLPLGELQDRMDVATELYEQGIVLIVKE